MNDFEYFLSEFVYSAAIHSRECQKKEYKKNIIELQFMLAKEDVRRFQYQNKKKDIN